jgi:putative PIN family toxin of toxin-antitoxin system
LLGLLEGRSAVLVLSSAVVKQYRRTLLHPAVTDRMKGIPAHQVDEFLATVEFLGERHRIAKRLRFRRDPTDEMFLSLAVAAKVDGLVTNDRDLLDVRSGHDDESTQIRRLLGSTRILTVGGALAMLGR